MEQHIQQGQNVSILLLVSSILIAGLLIGGVIIARGSVSVDSGSYQQLQQQTVIQPQQAAGQVPSCGI